MHNRVIGSLKLTGIVIIAFLFNLIAFAQKSNKCFEITGILVDPCAPVNNEAMYEMVSFTVGPNELNAGYTGSNIANQLNVKWPNNPWRGICNSQSSEILNALNSSLKSCGILKEPIAGKLPPGSRVVLIGSENVDINYLKNVFKPFQDLTDTLYVIFQCGGNIKQEHFPNLNTSNPGTYKLIMGFGNSCIDSVTYNTNNLIGLTGARVDYDIKGNPIYLNYGCRGLYSILTPEWKLPENICELSNPVILDSLVTGTKGGEWSGEGVFERIFYPKNYSDDSVKITYSVGNTNCAESSSQYIKVSGIPLPPVSDVSDGYCIGSSVDTIRVKDSYTGYSGIIKWYSDSLLKNIIDSGYSHGVNTSMPENFWITEQIGACISKASKVSIRFITTPVGFITTNKKMEICAGDSVLLTANGGNRYFWNINDSSRSVYVYKSGKYSVKVINQCGISDTNITILVDSIKSAPYADTLHGPSPLTVKFSSDNNFDNVLYSWNLGNGNTSNSKNVSTIYNKKGNYIASLNVINSIGCNDSATLTIYVDDELIKIKIPNVFTPDGDNHNDIFKPELSGIKYIKGTIFDRWGRMVYEWTNPENGWDGRKGGNNLPEGTYYYVIMFKDYNNKISERTGFFELLR
ncbi:MAG: gliding motility-associated C-terminal domain-containing protein [Bacteroidota bacterium]|nr:gliding motility-associated C-terminal domain-containing protein [Bacteroidota bacterium]